ncbi:MAG: N-acetylmuramoyl-L-alanine amidase [Anaerolineae bacterium]|nr:N-acetylmuramoyl-L-alanine amidase [Anaerolineae bacterium]
MKKTTVSTDPWALGWMIRVLVLLALLAAFGVPMGVIPIVAVESDTAAPDPENSGLVVIPLNAPTPTATAVPAPSLTVTPHTPRIGIIAGHSGSDSGAICADGLQEVDVNRDIARRVVALLAQRGWTVDLLDEFDVRLNGYQADALLSIHADSCNVPGKSGFKITRAEAGFHTPSADVLVDCLMRHYAARTGLEFDPYTITYDMTRYHAYYEIDRNTPAAIIEAGFMLDDRELLTQRPDVVASGIADGLVCFIEGESP